MNDDSLHIAEQIFTMISDNKISEIEAERLLNAITRTIAHVPTGITSEHTTKI